MAAALAAVGLVVWMVARGGRPDGPELADVAWLVNAQDCRWSEGRAPSGPMRAGTVLQVERGLAEIQFHGGARVVLEGPASLELLSANSARLARGKLAARVPDAARGFTVLSPQGRVIDLGTEFGVSVSDGGVTEVEVFEGEVDAAARAETVRLGRNQAARIDREAVTRRPRPGQPFVRAIVPPPVIVPRVVTLDFRRPVGGTLLDAEGRGTGLTHRLPGTGGRLAPRDPNLRLNADKGHLELTTTNSDLNTQYRLGTGEYLGLRLADLGFTGPEDFAVTAVIPNFPKLDWVNQFGLYAAARSDRNIRGGIFSHRPGQYTQNLVNNNRGKDADSHFVGLFTPGDDVRLTLRRSAGKYAMTVENLTTGATTTLTTRHPAFLDGQRDLYVGLFGANTRSKESKTLVVREFQVTVWTVAVQKN